MKVIGHRDPSAPPLADQAALARTAALVRGTARLVPRGGYRFASFDEADAWMTKMLLRTHERPSLGGWRKRAVTLTIANRPI